MHCPVGKIYTEHMKYGLISKVVPNKVFCEESTLKEYFKKTYVDKHKALPKDYDCSAKLKKDMKDTFTTECNNKTSCDITLTNSDIFNPVDYDVPKVAATDKTLTET